MTQKLVTRVRAKEERYAIVERIHMPATIRYVRQEARMPVSPPVRREARIPVSPPVRRESATVT
ncbi:hypothetical protein ACFC5T_40060 [Streptomyces sp. NPDC055961]|uniref:hypothetical protein n=1 Tax=Streptomyces sp. NPDC055961 TaxID=3345666 RepID=UPI0035E1F2BB